MQTEDCRLKTDAYGKALRFEFVFVRFHYISTLLHLPHRCLYSINR